MEKLITVLFDAEHSAVEASKAIEQLAINKDIAIAELYILSKNMQDNITVRDVKNQEISHSTINTFTGSVIGLLGDHLNVVASLMLRYSKTSGILQKTAKTITTRKTAIVAYIDEYWEIPLNVAMKPLMSIAEG